MSFCDGNTFCRDQEEGLNILNPSVDDISGQASGLRIQTPKSEEEQIVHQTQPCN